MPTPTSPLITSLLDQPAELFSWGELRWLCNDQLAPGALQTFGHCRIFVGQVNPLHYHPNCEELLYLLAGEGEHRFDADWLPLRTGSLIRIPAGVRPMPSTLAQLAGVILFVLGGWVRLPGVGSS